MTVKEVTIKKTFRLTQTRNLQLQILSEYFQKLGYKGSNTQVLETAIMDLYFNHRRTDYDFFEQKELQFVKESYEKHGLDPTEELERVKELNQRVRKENNHV